MAASYLTDSALVSYQDVDNSDTARAYRRLTGEIARYSYPGTSGGILSPSVNSHSDGRRQVISCGA